MVRSQSSPRMGEAMASREKALRKRVAREESQRQKATDEEREVDENARPPFSILNVGTAIALFLAVLSCPFAANLGRRSPLNLALLFFNTLNVFIAACEVILGFNIAYIRADYRRLKERYTGREWDACVAYLTMPLTPRELFRAETWARMWSTYALYDPSYQNQESFGFFIDFGNGLSTIPPSLLMNLAICFPDKVSSLWCGCIGLAMYWQVMYGAIIYILSFVFNQRGRSFGTLEVCLFVGVSNCIWIVFPIFGVYSCFSMLRDGNADVFKS